MATTGAAEFLTAAEIAKRFKVSVATVYRWRDRGYVQAVKIDRSVRFNAEDVERLLAEGAA